jgi:integrase
MAQADRWLGGAWPAWAGRGYTWKGRGCALVQLSGAVAEFLVALQQMGRSMQTVKQYSWHLARLVVWLDARGVVGLASLSRSLLREWGASLRDGWQPATCRQAVNAVRSWLRWCGSEYGVGGDLVSALVVPRVRVSRQRTLSLAEVRAVISACDESIRGRRDLALVSLLVDTGLRASEVCRLRLDDLDVGAGSLSVEIKGGRTMAGYFGDLTAVRLSRWLEVRQGCSSAVFVSVGGRTSGQALTACGLRRVLRNLGRLAGVVGVSPHAFRRSFATLALVAGQSTRAVQLLGRWSNVQMVERYSQALEVEQVRWSVVDGLLST